MRSIAQSIYGDGEVASAMYKMKKTKSLMEH